MGFRTELLLMNLCLEERWKTFLNFFKSMNYYLDWIKQKKKFTHLHYPKKLALLKLGFGKIVFTVLCDENEVDSLTERKIWFKIRIWWEIRTRGKNMNRRLVIITGNDKVESKSDSFDEVIWKV